ncbi:MAG: sugar transferase [Planctomycetota bacterium]
MTTTTLIREPALDEPGLHEPALDEAALIATYEALEARPTYELAKRALDVVLAVVALVLLSPLLLLLALLIKLEDGGPVLFSQVRVGRGGRWFRFYKLRSMSPDAEARRAALKARWQDEQAALGGDALRFKLVEDPRVTRVGRWLRRASLDELPQLVNVLLGDMSLVGPRPPIPEEVADYGPRERLRLEVEQGITCIWQVSGRSTIPFPRQVEMDLDYIRRRSLLLDLALLVRTIPAVLDSRGAY